MNSYTFCLHSIALSILLLMANAIKIRYLVDFQELMHILAIEIRMGDTPKRFLIHPTSFVMQVWWTWNAASRWSPLSLSSNARSLVCMQWSFRLLFHATLLFQSWCSSNVNFAPQELSMRDSPEKPMIWDSSEKLLNPPKKCSLDSPEKTTECSISIRISFNLSLCSCLVYLRLVSCWLLTRFSLLLILLLN